MGAWWVGGGLTSVVQNQFDQRVSSLAVSLFLIMCIYLIWFQAMEEAVVNSPNNATENGESNVGTITVNGTESRDGNVDSVNVQENSNTEENLNVVSLDALE